MHCCSAGKEASHSVTSNKNENKNKMVVIKKRIKTVPVHKKGDGMARSGRTTAKSYFDSRVEKRYCFLTQSCQARFEVTQPYIQ